MKVHNIDEIKFGVVDSTFKHIKYGKVSYEVWNKKSINLTVAKGEKFAFQILISSMREFFCSLDNNLNMSWKGINQYRARLEMNIVQENTAQENIEYSSVDLIDNFNMAFLGYVKDDTGALVSDPILTEPGVLVEPGVPQAIWVEGMIPYDFKGDMVNLEIGIFTGEAYEDETMVHTITVPIKVVNFNLPSLKESQFFLDLWQHPSNWARAYKVPLWSEDHFVIIENMIKELATMGEKVISCMVSDFPWAGQTCYEYPKNASNLYEYNMVKVFKDSQGNINCDFSNLDRYIEICMKHGINKELDFFGLLGNWEGRSFGNPMLEDGYREPIRIFYRDEESRSLKFIKTKKDFKVYLNLLFTHMVEKGWWDKVRIITDEPNNPEVVSECEDFINDAIKGHDVLYKSACHDKEFVNKFRGKLKDMSLNLKLTVESFSDLQETKEIINSKGGTLTWFVCCVPERPNNFISSPLIESRIIPWFTYYFNLDGFLRWDYAIWPEDPWNEPSYKYPRWKAGDMFFVYPGANLKPVRSMRWENMRFGIQDFEIFRHLENKGYNKKELVEKYLTNLLGKKDEMEIYYDAPIKMNYSFDYEDYMKVRESILEKLV